MNSLEKKLLEIWDDVQEKLGYPNLEPPVLVTTKDSGVSTACISMSTKEIKVSVDFLKELNLPLEQSYKGVVGHEANHYVTCPYDAKTLYLLMHEVSKIDKINTKDISNYFDDVVINLDLIKRGINEISLVYKNMDTTARIDETIKALYTYKTGLDFGVKNKNSVDYLAVAKLDKLDFYNLKLRALRKNAKKFAKIVSPLLSQDKLKNPKNKFGFIDSDISNTFSDGQIYNAIGDIVNELDPTEFKDVLKNLSPELATKSTIHYYEKLSKKFPVSIIPTNTKNGNYLLPYSQRDWEPGDETSKINIFKSKGKIFPGITKIITEKKYSLPILSEEKSISIPDTLIIVDSSASMINPHNSKSYAVLGGFCAANFYLKNEKEVGVINFSSEEKVLGYTKNKSKIYEAISLFQQGFTTLNIGTIKNLLETKEKSDIYLITDMGISNNDEVYNYLNTLNQVNRINIFNISPLSSTSHKHGFSIYNIQNEKDIPKIITYNTGKIAKGEL